MDIALLLLRLVAGLTLAAHGAQKLFGWFGGGGIRGTGQFFESQGFKPGKTFAVLGGLTELGGGLGLAIGLLTLAAAAAIGMMTTAIGVVHWKNGFFVTNGGLEFALLMATAAATISLGGPGSVLGGRVPSRRGCRISSWPREYRLGPRDGIGSIAHSDSDGARQNTEHSRPADEALGR